MAIPKKSALIISSHVNGLDPLEGVYQNGAGASKVLNGMKIPPDCSYGGEFSLSEFMEKIEKFFGKESEVHILWGIFHGAIAFDGEQETGCWVLSNNELVRLSCILQKWYFARDKGTAHHLLIISDACYSGHMVTEAAELALRDVSVQASCHPSFTSLDTEGECFSDLLVWRLERRYGLKCHEDRKIDMKVHLERSILNCHQPCFYSAVCADDLGWAFIDTSAVFSDLSVSSESCMTSHESPKVAPCQVMRARKKSALIISSHVNGLDPLEGVYQTGAGASKVLEGMKILPDCSYGGEFSLSEFMEKIENFFGKESEVHILWGIFHGAIAFDGEQETGCWVLSNNELVSLSCILQKWYFARDKGTAHHLLIISDACYSGHMVTEAAELALRDVSVQASCHPSFTSLDTERQCFSDLLVWRLERRYGLKCHEDRKIDMIVHLERLILNRHQPCFYSAVSAYDLGWAFIDVDAAFSEDSSEWSDSSTLCVTQ